MAKRPIVPAMVLVIGGFVLLGSAVVWRATIGHRWTDRLPPGWSWEARFSGTQTNADPVTGRVPDRDVLGAYYRRIHIMSDRGRPDSVRIRNELTIFEPLTGTTTWQYIASELVNPRTGERLEPGYVGTYAVLPRELARGAYRLHSNYLQGVKVRFDREELVAGVPTYVFSYRGRGEYGDSYAGTPDFPGIKLKPGEQILCANDQFYLRLWAEPRTGETVKIEEGCPSGDFVYDARGRALSAVDRWTGASSGTELLRRAAEVSAAHDRYLYLGVYPPWVLGCAGLLCLAAGAITMRARTT